MNGYLPHSLASISQIAVCVFVELCAGFALTRLNATRSARICGWLLVFVSVFTVEQLTHSEPAGVRMLVLIGALLLGMKVLVSIEERAAGRSELRPLSWFLFALCWPGMRPSTFSDVPGPARTRWSQLVKQGSRNLVTGAGLVAVAWLIGATVRSGLVPAPRVWMATLFLLPGLSLIFHFGIFHLLAGCWRAKGADCHALFRSPLHSTSLSEFWGFRWNLAFSEMTALVVFRPLRGLVGSQAAMLVAFLFSGLLHEIAISVPVRAGFGLPTLYFVFHAGAMQIERLLAQKNINLLTGTWSGRIWTLLWLLLPLPILFHISFLTGCVWPLIGLYPHA